MPLEQVREIFKPSFSVSVPPGAEFGSPTPQPDSGIGAVPPPGASAGDSAPTPMNTYEIGPSARKAVPSGPSAVAPASVAVAPTGPVAEAPPTPPSAASTASSSPVTTTGASHTSIQAEAAAHRSSGTLDSVKGLFDLR